MDYQRYREHDYPIGQGVKEVEARANQATRLPFNGGDKPTRRTCMSLDLRIHQLPRRRVPCGRSLRLYKQKRLMLVVVDSESFNAMLRLQEI